MASSLVKMGAADGEVDVNAFAFDIEKVIDSLSSVEAQLDTSAVIDEDTGRVSYGTSVNFDQEVRTILMKMTIITCGHNVFTTNFDAVMLTPHGGSSLWIFCVRVVPCCAVVGVGPHVFVAIFVV